MRCFGSKKMSKLYLLRHSKSQLNHEDKFAGWVDTPLHTEGIEGAKRMGAFIKREGFFPDIVYASPLKRASHTAEIVTGILGFDPQNIIWDKRLFERFYGGLTERNREEVKKEVGEKQLELYRRSYDSPLPPMDSERLEKLKKQDLFKNLPFPILPFETLKNVVENRVRPFWEDTLKPRILENKNVLIVAHGNSLRALIMIIENLTPEKVFKLEVKHEPPINYSFKNNTIELLD